MHRPGLRGAERTVGTAYGAVFDERAMREHVPRR